MRTRFERSWDHSQSIARVSLPISWLSADPQLPTHIRPVPVIVLQRSNENRPPLWRDNLDENGCGNLEIEATAGSGPIIIWSSELRKHFLSISLLDWR